MTSLLASIASPDDLRLLPEERLPLLAEEIRQFTIDTVARTGGHLGASLGVVELTVALHYVFDTPRDPLIWDVGHQSYPHKILTGRREQMGSLRQRHGLSGFTKREESPYDPFGAGHSSTSISAALGLAMAIRHRQGEQRAVAVIGDGALTAGMAYEALNNAGQHDDVNLVVVLNDNEMSISPNVGAMSAYLSRILSGRFYTRLKGRTQRVLEKISPPLLGAARRAEEHMKGFLTPGTLFEELGFTYFGPIDGHDFGSLLPTLRNIRVLTGPVLLHVVTRKGKGYPPAEESPCTYHGVVPFDRATGKALSPNGTGTSTSPSFTRVFSDALIELAQTNPRIMAITAAMPEGTGLLPFQERFPHRFFDVGIAEQHAVTFAAGLACEGFVPVVAIYSTFLQRAYDQVVHDVALQDLAVVFAVDRGGLVGADGPTHAGAYDLTFLRAIPGMVIMVPADEPELRGMLAAAVTLGRPVALRYPRGNVKNLPERQTPAIAVGVGRRLREGDRVALCAIGEMAHTALEAALVLEAEGISVAVFDCRFVKPLDERLLREAARCPVLITLEENTVLGGFGAAVLEFLARDGLLDGNLKVRTWGLPDRFIPHGSQEELRRELLLDADGVALQIRQLLQE
ncbi:MAG: 1-deoxy-D-xylulose-5-phosphate synthase [Magnetococcales bacterium]|nr:1-deoxy-D-xylulose-5-phosphate synthase [Magnetococcales bacterium]MBF0157231.1 1-deoxy-D-xylulose-5-phosphate synthase [Magnetococcales bacterium]